MGYSARFSIFRENHIGIGIRWQIDCQYQLHLSIAFPFFTVTFGLGKQLFDNPQDRG